MVDKTAKNSKVEKFIGFTVWFLLLAGLILLIGDKKLWPDFYSPDYFSFFFFSSAALILAPEYIFKTDDERRKKSILLLRFTLAASLLLNALGELYLFQLYRYGFQYDKLLHSVSSFLFILVFIDFFKIWKNFPLGRILLFSAVLTLVGGIAWEALEFTFDALFKTKEFGIYGQDRLADTFWDLFSDLFGAAAGAAYWLYWDCRRRLSRPKF